MEQNKRVGKMKILKVILVILIIGAIGFCGYYGYNYFKQWEADRFSEINMLKSNQDLFLQKITELSTTITHIVNDTAKITTVAKPDNTYEALKAEVIELKKNEDANKDEINSLKEKLSEQRRAFLNSDDTVLIKKDGENILLYRDTEGNLQPASEGIEKIIEHKDVSTMYTPIEKAELEVTKLNLKAGGYYAFDQTYGVIISKGIFTVKDYSLNASVLLSDYKNLKFAVGGDVGYLISDNLELGIGYNTNKEYYIKLQYSF